MQEQNQKFFLEMLSKVPKMFKLHNVRMVISNAVLFKKNDVSTANAILG